MSRPPRYLHSVHTIAYPFRSTRLWYKGLRMVVGQKEGSSTWAQVLVSNSGKRRYTLLLSLFCWANAHYRQPNSLSEDLVPTEYNGFRVVPVSYTHLTLPTILRV